MHKKANESRIPSVEKEEEGISKSIEAITK